MPLNRARRFVVTFTLHFFPLVSEGKLAATATGTDRNLFIQSNQLQACLSVRFQVARSLVPIKPNCFEDSGFLVSHCGLRPVNGLACSPGSRNRGCSAEVAQLTGMWILNFSPAVHLFLRATIDSAKGFALDEHLTAHSHQSPLRKKQYPKKDINSHSLWSDPHFLCPEFQHLAKPANV